MAKTTSNTPKLFASSQYRHRASPSEKLQYGGSTVTEFLVGVEGSDASTWQRIQGYGRLPGNRKTDALNRFRAMVARGEVP